MSAITKDLQYTMKPSSVKGKRYTRVIPSLSSRTYNFGDTVIFQIPAGMRNQVMDGSTAYLRFTLRMTLTATAAVAAGAFTARFDYTASSLIRRLDLYGSGGALLESIDNYGVLANILYDVTHSQSELKGLSSLIGSTEGDTTTATNRLGFVMPNAVAGAAGTFNADFTFSIPILSSIFSLSEKFFPVYACNDDLRLEILLNTQVYSLVHGANPADGVITFSVLNPEIVCDYVELEESAIQSMKSLYGGNDIVLHATTYHNYQSTIATGVSNQYSSILPSKVMSAKNLLVAFRALSVVGDQDSYSQSVRTNPFTGALSSFNINAGGMRIPQRPITVNTASDISEFQSELNKAFHALNMVNMAGCLDRTCYVSTATVGGADLPSIRGFVVGLNLDSYIRSSEVVLSGLDLSKVTTYLEMNLVTAVPATQTVDAFVYHDILVIVGADGSVTSKF